MPPPLKRERLYFPTGTNIPGEVVPAGDSEGERFPVLKKCATEEPLLREVKPNHWAACHVTENYDAAPATKCAEA